MDEPAAVLPELKLNHCWPSSGAYPAKIPLTTSTGPPVPPTVHPVKNVLPAERSLVVFAAICGASNPPLAKAPTVGGAFEDEGPTVTSSNTKSTPPVWAEVSVKRSVALLEDAVKLNCCSPHA